MTKCGNFSVRIYINMHANVRSLNKKQPNYCKNCIAKMYENRDDIVSDLSVVISIIQR